MSQRLKVPALALLAGLVAAACAGDPEQAAELEVEGVTPGVETVGGAAGVEGLPPGSADEAARGEVPPSEAAFPPVRQETAPPPPPVTGSPATAGAAPPNTGSTLSDEVDLLDEDEVVPPGAVPVALPAGARMVVVLDHTISTRSHQAGERFEARVVEEVLAADGMVLVPEGARLMGRVVESEASRDADREAALVVAFESLVMNGSTFPLRSTVVEVEMAADAGDSGTRSAAKVATGAAAGAVIGQILGRDTRSTVQGAVAGAAVGAGVAVTTRDGHAQIPEGARLVVQVDEPVILAASH